MRLSPSNVAHWRGCRAGGAALRGTREAVQHAARGSRRAKPAKPELTSPLLMLKPSVTVVRGVAVARRSPACRWCTPRPRRATPELCTSARIATRAAAASVGNV